MGQTCTLEIMSALTGEPVDSLIRKALEQHEGAVAKAARTLGISRQALYQRLDGYPELKQYAGRARRAAGASR